MRNEQGLCRFVCSSLLLLIGCFERGKPSLSMTRPQLLSAVSNETIQFVTTAAVDAPLPQLGRRIVVTGPPEVVELMLTDDVRVLTELVTLMSDPKRAWAAEIVLASLTRQEEDLVNAFAARPDEWHKSFGSEAQGRWNRWLKSREGKLRWDPESHVFVGAADGK